MLKHLLSISRYLFLLFGLCALYSCNNDHEQPSINESEYYYNDRLVSISSEGDSAYWIGSQYGDVYYNNGPEKNIYHIGSDRIYKVYTQLKTATKKICWIGERNAGLQKWEIGKSGAKRIAEYYIPNKGLHYSVYDIVSIDKRVFAATSQGVFLLDESDEKPRLKIVYPHKKSDVKLYGTTFVARNICRVSPEKLLVATQNGLLNINIKTLKTSVTLNGENIYHVVRGGDNVNVLTDDNLYVESVDGKIKRSIELNFHANTFYVVGQYYCFLDINKAILTKDLKHFINIPLRRSLPQYSGNVVITDSRCGYVMMVMEDALWQVPKHQSVFNKEAHVVTSCVNENGDIFYVNTDNEIFLQKTGSKITRKIFDFIHEDQIVDMYAKDDMIYYLTNKQMVRKIKITDNLIRNLMLSHKIDVYKSKAKVTSFSMIKSSEGICLYLGIQDGLVKIDMAKNLVDTIKMFNDKYITSFYNNRNSDNFYLTTLNHGVYFGNGRYFKPVKGTNRLENIHDMAVTDEFPTVMMMLAGNSLMLTSGNRTYSIDAKGVNKIILANDSVGYLLLDVGIRKFVKRGDKLLSMGEFYRDIRFNPSVSFALNGKIYLGCSLGELSLTPGRESKAEWVTLENCGVTRRGVVTVFAGLLLIILLAGIVFFGYRKLYIKHIVVRKRDLNKRLSELESVCELLQGRFGDDMEWLEKEIKSVRIDSLHFWKQNNEKMAKVSDVIMRMNRDTALLLMKKINKQSEQLVKLENYDGKELLKRTLQAQASGMIENFRKQALKNDQYLKKLEKINIELDYYIDSLDGTLIITGLNDNIVKQIDFYKMSLVNKSMNSIECVLNSIRKQYKIMLGDNALELIERYVVNRKKELEAIDSKDAVVDAVLEQLNSVTSDMKNQDRLKLLRKLEHTDNRIKQVIIRKDISKQMNEYACTRKMIIDDNAQKINIKSERQIECEVASCTREQTQKIAQLVSDIYILMRKTDAKLVDDILQFANFDNQQAKVLALLVANHKVKRTYISGMLGLMGNLNPVISRLINNKIKPNEEALKDYYEHHPASFVPYILMLV